MVYKPETSVKEMEVVDEKIEVNPADLTIDEKIKLIVKESPFMGAFKIKKELNTARFGFTKIGWFEVRSRLAKLNLNSRTRRYEYATSA